MRQSMVLKTSVCAVALLLAACGGGGGGAPAPVAGGGGSGGSGGTPPPPPPVLATKIDTPAEAADFAAITGFGPTQTQIDLSVGKDAAEVLRTEFDKPRRDYEDRVRTLYDSYDGNGRRNTSHRSIFWKDIISRDDQLRQRMTFALSQIIVVSDKEIGDKPTQMAYYMDILNRNAFGNYRTLLEEITYSPAMGEYLTYRGNRKGDTRTGRTPDENYAREIMQLFTIGLVELNTDGTPKLDASGEPIPSYTNEDIVGLARVFTGLDLQPKDPNESNDRVGARRSQPMRIREDRHETLEKSFLGQTIPEGTTAEASIDQALDILFEHPNTAPFLSRQLIQRFTASNPEPAYVARVAGVFESGSFTAPNGRVFGTGERGDLEATLAAILLDESQHTDGTIRDLTDLGKVREPVLNFVHWARAFNAAPVLPEREWILLYDSENGADHFGQRPLSSPSVFNFYRPGFVPVGTESGDQGLTVPEFQTLLAGNRAGYINSMSEFVFDTTSGPDNRWDSKTSFVPDYSDEIALVNDAAALADHLDGLLLGGRMSDETRRVIVEGVPAIPVRTDTAENTNADEFKRAAFAVLVAVTAPEYMVR